jgi:predicted dehydrogenase
MMHTDCTFRVGVIGYGLAGAYFHAPFIATTPGLQLSMIVTRDPGRQAQAAREHPGARVVSTVDELWQSARDLDVVVVATPNRSHVDLARAAIDAGLAAVVDKPLAARAADARSLIAHAQAAGKILTVYQNRRWDGDFVTLRRVVKDGGVGQPLRFESRFERWRPTRRAGWRQLSMPEDAGGLLFDLGSHLIDQALLLFGPVAHVYAELDRRHPEAEVDDDSFVALTHRSGVRTHLFMSVMAAQQGPRFRLLGSKAGYVKYGLDVQEDALRAGGRPDSAGWGEEPVDRWGQLSYGDERQAVSASPGAYQEFYRGLVRALRGEGPAPVDPADAARTLDVIETAHRAAAARQVMEMPDAEN